MFHRPTHQGNNLQIQSPAVDPFYTATKRRSRGALWSIFAPALSLWGYCQEHGIVFTQSRAYRKNDQAWVEQKNGAIVRKLIGYGRLEGLGATAALRRLYEVSRLYINFFQPSFKLKSKRREGARVHKQYHAPETPCRRLLQREDIAPEKKQALRLQMESLDPVLLLKQLREAQDTVRAFSQSSALEAVPPDVVSFVGSLSSAW